VVAAVQLGHAVRKGNAELLARITEGLAILKQTGRYEEIRHRCLGVLEPPAFDWALFARYAAVVIVPLLLGLAAAVAWSRSQQRLLPASDASFFFAFHPSDLAAISMGRTGTTRIGRYLLDHGFMIPGFVGVGVSTMAAWFLSRVAF